MMLPFADAFRFCAAEHFDHVLDSHPEAAFLSYAIDARKKFLRSNGAIPRFARRKTVVARATITRILLTKVIQQERAAAGGRFGVVNGLLQLSAGDVALLRIRHLVDETAVFDTVTRAEEEQAFAGQSVAAGTARFLVVT